MEVFCQVQCPQEGETEPRVFETTYNAQRYQDDLCICVFHPPVVTNGTLMDQQR